MAWEKNGTPDTLTGTATALTISDLTAKIFNVFMVHTVNRTGSVAINPPWQFNSNSNNVYTERQSNNGATDSTRVNQSFIITIGSGPHDVFNIAYVCSISGEEKLLIGFGMHRSSAGAGFAPGRVELVGKFVPSPDADITTVAFLTAEADTYGADSNLSALGTDTIIPFSPDSIAGLKLWLDADDAATITESGNLVSQWDDKSGQGNDVSEATNKPTVVASSMNGKPTIQFDGVNDTLSRATFTAGAISQNITIFMVYNQTLNAGTRMFFESSVANNIVSFWNNTTPEYGIDAGTGLIEEPPSPSVPTGDVFRHDLYSGVSSFSKFANVTILSGNAGTNSMDGIFLASENDKTNHMEIDFAEILIYDSDITGADFANIQTYLANKWGVTTS